MKKEKNLYKNTLNKLIDNYRMITKKSAQEMLNDILDMAKFSSEQNINEIVATNYILIGNDQNNISNILNKKKQIQELNNKIFKLEEERTIFFNNLCCVLDCGRIKS